MNRKKKQKEKVFDRWRLVKICLVGSLKLAISTFIFCSPLKSSAQNSLGVNFNGGMTDGRIAEYFYNRSRADFLIKVSLVGRVKNPGLYHVPKSTSLLTLITISGGPVKEADVESIHLSRRKSKIKKYNLTTLMSANESTALEYGDVIYIPKKDRLFDQNTSTIVSTISAVMGLIISALVLAGQ